MPLICDVNKNFCTRVIFAKFKLYKYWYNILLLIGAFQLGFFFFLLFYFFLLLLNIITYVRDNISINICILYRYIDLFL